MKKPEDMPRDTIDEKVEYGSTILVSGCDSTATISFEGHVGLISRAKCSASRRPSAICLGESQQMMDSGRILVNMEPLGSEPRKAGAEVWSERFQDLQSWCLKPPQDELHTPQINDQNEFNFSVDVANVKSFDEPSLVDSEGDLWGADLFETNLNEEENNNNENFTLMKMPSNTNEMFDTNNFLPTIKSPLKCSSENIMLSQGAFVEQSVKGMNLPNHLSLLGDGTIKEEDASFRVPQSTTPEAKERPKLMLNIAAATSSKSNSAVFTLSTPDVMKHITDVNGSFDLVNYVANNDDYDAMLVQSFDTSTVVEDHDYTGSKPVPIPIPLEEWQIKAEPLSPAQEQLFVDEIFKAKAPGDKVTERGRKVKRKRRESESDYDYVCDEQEESSDSNYSPGPSKKKPRQKRKSKDSFKPEPSTSSTEPDKYRELRDKNNEASRRSRYNRKQKDVETRLEADKLERENIRLKVKAQRMEKLVIELRALVLKSIKNNNSKNSGVS